MIDVELPASLREVVRRELESGERIQWIGMPRRVFFTPFATGAFLFGLLWTAFALFWTACAAWVPLQAEAEPEMFGLFSLLFPLFGLPFILFGFGMMSLPIWAYRRAGQVVYVITDRRAITFDGGWWTTIRSYPPSKLTDIYRKEKADGSGDVIISRRAWRDSYGDRQSEELGFLRIEDVKNVEQRLKDLAGPRNAEDSR